jgi:vitamin B12 transporter
MFSASPYNKGVFLLCLLACTNTTFSQITELEMVDVIDSIQNPMESSYTITIDSLDLINMPLATMDQILTEKAGIFFKNTGPGLLSTPSIRGGDAGNTNVLWNGIPIRSTMLGTIDFTGIGGIGISQIEVSSGGSSNVFGSGGNGGTINFLSAPSFSKRTAAVDLSLGSFDQVGLQTRINIPFTLGKGPFALSISNGAMRSKNEFDYSDISSEPYLRVLNTGGTYAGANTAMSIAAHVSEKVHLKMDMWNTRFRRSIPSTINVTKAPTSQNDTATRMQFQAYYRPINRLKLKQVVHYERNTNHYIDTNSSINNSNEFYLIQSLTNIDFTITNHWTIESQVSGSWTEASSNNYSGFQQRLSSEEMVKLNGRILKDHIHLDAGTRILLIDGYSKLLPFGGVSYKPVLDRNLQVFVSGGKTARIPTLNELYWAPGGNPMLAPETGYNGELGVRVGKHQSHASAAIFYGQYLDRIRWLPNGGIFSPINIAVSEVYGVDIQAKKQLKIGRKKLTFTLNGSYTESFGQEAPDSVRYSTTYVPKLNGGMAVSYAVKAFNVSYHHRYTSKRYNTSDESGHMPQFDVADLRMNWRKQDGILGLSFSIQNIFNVDYQSLPWRPMPGRNYLVSIHLGWNE